MTRAITVSSTVSLVTEECCNCGVLFAMPTDLNEARVKDHGWFYCPNGHVQHYTGKTKEQREAERLRKQLEQQRVSAGALRDQLAAAERSARSYKGQATKMRRRVLRGACPFCNRSFENVTRHMETKHAEKLDAEGVHVHGEAS